MLVQNGATKLLPFKKHEHEQKPHRRKHTTTARTGQVHYRGRNKNHRPLLQRWYDRNTYKTWFWWLEGTGEADICQPIHT